MTDDEQHRAGSGATARPLIAGGDGERLRVLRADRRLSQEKLAGVSPGTVARLERAVDPSCHRRLAVQLAVALGVEPAELIRPSGTAGS